MTAAQAQSFESQEAFDAWFGKNNEAADGGEEWMVSRSARRSAAKNVVIGHRVTGSFLGRAAVALAFTFVSIMGLATIGSILVERQVERDARSALAANGIDPDALTIRARWRTVEISGSVDQGAAKVAEALAPASIVSAAQIRVTPGETSEANADLGTASTGEAIALQLEPSLTVLSGTVASEAARVEFVRIAGASLGDRLFDVVAVEPDRALFATPSAAAFARVVDALDREFSGGLSLQSDTIQIRLRHPEPEVVAGMDALVAELRREGVSISSEISVR